MTSISGPLWPYVLATLAWVALCAFLIFKAFRAWKADDASTGWPHIGRSGGRPDRAARRGQDAQGGRI